MISARIYSVRRSFKRNLETAFFELGKPCYEGKMHMLKCFFSITIKNNIVMEKI